MLQIRPADQCRFDLVSLGEIMLRVDPSEGRVGTARSFRCGKAAVSTTSPVPPACPSAGTSPPGRPGSRAKPGNPVDAVKDTLS